LKAFNQSQRWVDPHALTALWLPSRKVSGKEVHPQVTHPVRGTTIGLTDQADWDERHWRQEENSQTHAHIEDFVTG